MGFGVDTALDAEYDLPGVLRILFQVAFHEHHQAVVVQGGAELTAVPKVACEC